uniref:Uncharacterized protein n=1 Tax=Panagrolaimus sp. PS1159 TaxID=55785 RepID=A0AC35FYV4_9BILA
MSCYECTRYMNCNACTRYVICDECSRLACRGNSCDKEISMDELVTRKAGMSWYGPAVACAWQVQDYLIAASWQVPVANSGYCNNICIGITHPGIKYYQITQNSLETILGNEKSEKRAQHAINYYEGGKKSGFFSTIQKLVIDNNIEDQTIKNQYIKVKVKMTKGPICSLSIQVFPMSVNNYAPELINYVVEQKRHICIHY